jgi:hypothetical protein
MAVDGRLKLPPAHEHLAGFLPDEKSLEALIQQRRGFHSGEIMAGEPQCTPLFPRFKMKRTAFFADYAENFAMHNQPSHHGRKMSASHFLGHAVSFCATPRVASFSFKKL